MGGGAKTYSWPTHLKQWAGNCPPVPTPSYAYDLESNSSTGMRAIQLTDMLGLAAFHLAAWYFSAARRCGC